MITFHLSNDVKEVSDILFSEGLTAIFQADQPDVTKDTFQLDPSVSHLITKKDEDVVGIFRVRPTNAVLLEAHISILKKYWGSNIRIEVGAAFLRAVKEKTVFKKVWSPIPESCKHVIKYLEYFEFERFGELREGTIHNGKVQTLIYFCKTV